MHWQSPWRRCRRHVPVDADSITLWRRECPGTLDQVQVVRSLTAHLLVGFPALGDVLLILNKLAVNALANTRSGHDGGYFAVDIRQDMAGVIVRVMHRGRARASRAPIPPMVWRRVTVARSPRKRRPPPGHGRATPTDAPSVPPFPQAPDTRTRA